MEQKGRVERNFSRFVVWAALATTLLIGCGGGGGGSGGGAGPFDSVAPAVVSSAPADGAIDVAIDASLKIAFTEPVDPVTVNGTTVKIRAGDTEMAGSVCCAHDTITFTPATNWGFATTYTVTISGGTSGVKDLAGNFLAADHTWTFSTGQAPDTSPPAVTAMNPFNGATGVSVNAIITVSFSEVVTNVTSETFQLAAGGIAISGAVTTSGSTAIFTPSAPLASNTTYTAAVTTEVTDQTGNSLAAAHTWTFSTGQASDAIPPRLTAMNPINGATGVSVNTTVTAIFSEVVTNATQATIRLETGGVAVPGEVTISGSTTIFTPSAPLAYNTTYITTVSTGVTDLAGNPLSAAASWTFTTTRQSEGPITIISSGTDSVSGAQLAMDATGTAVAVWIQGNWIWSNRYVSGTGWTVATRINSGTGGAEAPQVAMGGNGAATAVWRQWDGAQYSIYANRYVPGIGWETATVIETLSGEAGGPQVAMDNNGNAITVWPPSDGSTGNIFANHYVLGTGWGMEALIQATVGDAYLPQVVMNNGDAFSVWIQYDPKPSIHANRYVLGTGWGTETRLDTAAKNAYSPQVAMDGSGKALAVWGASGGSVLDNSFGGGIWVNRYVPGTGWETPTAIWTSTWGGGQSQISMDGAGNALVVWKCAYPVGGGSYGSIMESRIMTSSYVPGTGWTEPAYLDTRVSSWGHQGSEPKVAMDHKGNAIAVWHQSANGIGPWHVYASYYVSGTGWGTANVVETSAEDALFPRVVTDGDGNFIILWQQWDGTRYNVSAVRYQVP